jgi:hypothetical protein
MWQMAKKDSTVGPPAVTPREDDAEEDAASPKVSQLATCFSLVLRVNFVLIGHNNMLCS